MHRTLWLVPGLLATTLACNAILGIQQHDIAPAGGGAGAPADDGPDVVSRSGCVIGDSTYSKDDQNPATPCQSCQPTEAASSWSDVTDGTGCGSGGVCRSGQCISGCIIGRVFYDVSEADPNEPCATCQPGKSTSDWSPIPDGVGCGNGQVCASGTCGKQCSIEGTGIVPSGETRNGGCEICKPGTSTTAWSRATDGTGCGDDSVCVDGTCGPGCFIDQAVYAPEDTTSNGCQVCAPSESITTWTNASEGTSCGNGLVCSDGACGSACFISGAVYAGDATNPDGCLVCKPETSTTDWTAATDGTSCGVGKVCSSGTCESGCAISGAFHAPADQTASGCLTCAPAQSTTAWSVTSDGTSCDAGKVCKSGACEAGCFISGTVYASNAHANSGCESCKPDVSTTAWVNAAAGTSCGAGMICNAGSCESGCFIGGVVYAADATTNEGCSRCDPAVSTTAWTKEPDSNGCPSGSGICSSGACAKSVSCAGGGKGQTFCGTLGDNCCTSPLVSGGDFYRTYSNTGSGATGLSDAATVSSFRLDKYLVTVARFRQFVNAWNQGYLPPDGSGIHTHLNGGKGVADSATPGAYETGWDASSWNLEISPTNDHLVQNCFEAYATWTPTSAGNEDLPINCVNWFEAASFCIWDGGFLPSEAEYGYAEAGGGGADGLRAFPWGSTDPGTASQYAIYNCYYGTGGTCTSRVNIAPVGAAFLGAGAYGQLDLAGNLYEWLADWQAPYISPCTDCANLTTPADAFQRARINRGGNYSSDILRMNPTFRGWAAPISRYTFYGFRCARAP